MAAAKTIRDIQAEKNKKDVSEITIQNISKQMVPINLKAPKNVDFYAGTSEARLQPGRSITLKKSKVWIEQINRLASQQFISIIRNT